MRLSPKLRPLQQPTSSPGRFSPPPKPGKSALGTRLYSSNALVCHKFLLSEVEVNCQKSFCTESRDAKQWRKNEQIYRNTKCEIYDIISVIGCIILLRVHDNYMQHTLAELVNQHRDQKEPDSHCTKNWIYTNLLGVNMVIKKCKLGGNYKQRW